jgi:hypothetical protein
MSMTEQDIKNAERLSKNLVKKAGVISYKPLEDFGTTNIIRDAGLAGYGSSGTAYKLPGENNPYASIPSGPGALTDAQVASIIKRQPIYGGTTPTGPQSTMGGFESLLNSLLGGGSGKGIDASDRLARDKFNYEKQQNARKASGLSDYYTGGSYNTGFDALLKMIADQGKVSEQNVTGAYERALGNINQGYQAAQTLGDEGYSALNAYLAANQNNPYAGMTAQVGSSPDALTNYLSAYGVSDQPVQGQIQADQLQAQQGAANYQNLLDTLSAVAQQSAGSRGTESQLAQLLFNTGLGQERAGYRSQAENAQAAALAQLQQQLFESRFGVEQSRNTLAQELAQTVAELTGKAPTKNSGGNDDDDNKSTSGQLPQTATQQEIVANQLANLLAPAQAQNSTAEQLLAELNARRGR